MPESRSASDKPLVAGITSPGKRALRDCIAFVSVGSELDEFLLNSLHSLRRIDSSIPAYVFVGAEEKERIVSLTNSLDVTVVALPGPTDYSPERYNEFGSKDFNLVANRKWDVFLELFDLGYEAVICSDVDIVFLTPFRNYLQSVMKVFPAGFQSEATAEFPPLLCSGFMFFRSIWADEVRFFRNASLKSLNDYNDQDLVNARLSADSAFRSGVIELPSHLFPNGRMIAHTLSQLDPNESVGAKPFLFHANWVVGLEAKKRSLSMIGQWRQ